MSGINDNEANVISTLIGSINESAKNSINSALPTSTNCIDKKRLIVSTSDVQRWIRSPVFAFT